MELKSVQFKMFLPIPVTLITTVNAQGVYNGAPYSCVMPVLGPLNLISIASALPRDTLRNIRETNQFVVNVIGKPEFRKAMSCAKSYPPDVNEMKEVGLETAPSKKISPPRIIDAVGWIEAVMEKEVVGENYSVIIGRVLCSEVNDLYWNGGKLTEDPLVLLALHFRTLGDRIAKGEEFIDHSTHPEAKLS
jgi:flavin reductase (DIM6/NTAB) family NADH-FMN oxidoreductase RutF